MCRPAMSVLCSLYAHHQNVKSARSTNWMTWANRMCRPAMSVLCSLYAHHQNVNRHTKAPTMHTTKCDVAEFTWPPIFAIIHSCGPIDRVSRFKLVAHTKSKNSFLLKSPWTKYPSTKLGTTSGRIASVSSSSWYGYGNFLCMQYKRWQTQSRAAASNACIMKSPVVSTGMYPSFIVVDVKRKQ